MRYGFAIDHRLCIGCHACTVACKAENDVPVGDFRTWVKYVEQGTFPEVRRHFTVLRCNHCDQAPCVEICPVNALEKRPDAIVDLDRDLCIGCRACMQACPYDALYLNEDKGVAEKCHYCAHRTELGLEPACVVVCPERAIVAGDTDDPGSELSKLIAEQPTSRRRVEKGTEPRVWYVEALGDALVPGATRQPGSWLWSERRGPPPPSPGAAGMPEGAPLTTLDVTHRPAWGWHVWTYMTTKNLASGAGLVAPFLAAAGMAPGALRDLVPEVVGLVFLAVTVFLLVHDLGRPERALKLLTNPNPRSWLVKGAWVLAAFGLLLGASLLLGVLGLQGAQQGVRWAGLPVAALASGYTAWLFAQCRGRDLWCEPGLLPALLMRAGMFGAGLGMLLAEEPAADSRLTLLFLFLLLGVQGLMVFERFRKPASRDARGPRILLDNDRSALAGTLLLAAALVAGLVSRGASGPWTPAILQLLALLLAAGGTLLHERAWIRAGQAFPNS